MSRLTPLELMLANLKQQIEKGRREYCPIDDAHKALVEMTGQDFGLDVSQWEKWIKQNPDVTVSEMVKSRANKLFPIDPEQKKS